MRTDHPSAIMIPEADMPTWMRRARRGTDWSLLLVAVLTLGIGWSFLTKPGFSPVSSSLNYAFMASDTATALREGRFYPRWSPHVLAGYGAPVPHYTPPGAAYTIALVEILFTNDALNALRLVYAGALMLAGVGMYALVSRWQGAAGGLIAALLYSFSPYIGRVLPGVRGEVPELLALALLPVLLWAVNRLLLFNQPPDFAWVALLTAALLLTEPRGLLMGGSLALLLCLVHLLTGVRRWRVLSVLAALVIGGALAAMYWLPALLEWHLVRWLPPEFNPVPARAGQLSLTTLWQPLAFPDPADLAPLPQLTLGPVLAGFALVGVIGGLRYAKTNRYPLLFLAVGVGILLTLLLKPAVGVAAGNHWLTGLLTFCLAVGGGAVISLRQRLRPAFQRLMLPVLVALILAGSLSVWTPQTIPARGPVVTTRDLLPVDQIRYEQQLGRVAVLPPGAAVPTTLNPATDANPTLTGSYQFGTLEKLLPTQVIRSGQLSLLVQGSHEARYQIRTDLLSDLNCRSGAASPANCRSTPSTQMTWLTACFPGWQAFVNETALNLRCDPATGLMTLQLPTITARNTSDAPTAELVLTLGETPIRTSAWVLTWAGLVILLAIWWLRVGVRGRGGGRADLHFLDDKPLLTPAEHRLLLTVALLAAGVFLLINLPGTPLKPGVRHGSGLDAMTESSVQTEVGLQLAGYHLDRLHYHPGDTFEVALYWRALRTLPTSYRVRLWLEDVNRLARRVEQPLRDPGGLPTRLWTTDGYVRDVYRLNLPADLFTGNYRVTLEVYTCATEADCTRTHRLTFFDLPDNLPQNRLQLPPVITVE